MTAGETLAHVALWRLRGREIAAGTPLETLSWGPGRRAWAHRNPRCEERKAREGGSLSRRLHRAKPPAPRHRPPTRTQTPGLERVP